MPRSRVRRACMHAQGPTRSRAAPVSVPVVENGDRHVVVAVQVALMPGLARVHLRGMARGAVRHLHGSASGCWRCEPRWPLLHESAACVAPLLLPLSGEARKNCRTHSAHSLGRGQPDSTHAAPLPVQHNAHSLAYRSRRSARYPVRYPVHCQGSPPLTGGRRARRAFLMRAMRVSQRAAGRVPATMRCCPYSAAPSRTRSMCSSLPLSRCQLLAMWLTSQRTPAARSRRCTDLKRCAQHGVRQRGRLARAARPLAGPTGSSQMLARWVARARPYRTDCDLCSLCHGAWGPAPQAPLKQGTALHLRTHLRSAIYCAALASLPAQARRGGESARAVVGRGARLKVAAVRHDAAQVQGRAGLHALRERQDLRQRAHALRHLARRHRDVHLRAGARTPLTGAACAAPWRALRSRRGTRAQGRLAREPLRGGCAARLASSGACAHPPGHAAGAPGALQAQVHPLRQHMRWRVQCVTRTLRLAMQPGA